jgi:tRNA-specific 2-thiouridylase
MYTMKSQVFGRFRHSSGTKVFVGLSGGVDSSVSAALLKRAGYDVTGVFIKVWQPDWIECSWREERRDAMRVAAHLNIPFVTLDLEKEYKEGVIDYMIAEYRAGRTPNPDVMCNRQVKFGAFWQWAKAQGAEYVATGHYARIGTRSKVQGTRCKGQGIANHRRLVLPCPLLLAPCSLSLVPCSLHLPLLAGVDTNKDQSYFLWTLNQNDLPHILFPVGEMTKFEVRKLAAKFKLPTATKKDSQGLCFIGKVDLKEFLSHYIQAKKGNVLDQNGEVIGTHPGALFFTIGERHGFDIPKKSPQDRPYFVTDKDVERNTITVSNKDADQLLPGAQRMVRLTNVNWTRGSVPEFSPDETATFSLHARSRYRAPLQKMRIVAVNISETTIEFEKPQDTLSPGQSVVIYDKAECLGGGVIEG